MTSNYKSLNKLSYEIGDLIKNHSFKLFLRTQNANSIRLTIPEEYITDFDKGLNF
jgi:hypothetical protein